jgi:hypothetical protein
MSTNTLTKHQTNYKKYRHVFVAYRLGHLPKCASYAKSYYNSNEEYREKKKKAMRENYHRKKEEKKLKQV